ncbi:hypothetical protein [Sinisalibacter lacisalsi]|nr:hypothetical protein [Sinisalibacter lacisalsi]
MSTAQIITSTVSVLALFISVASFLNSAATDKRNRRRDANLLVLQVEDALHGLEAKRIEVLANWNALYAALGMLESGARQGKEMRLDKVRVEIAVCNKDLEKAKTGIDKLSGKRLEQRLIDLRQLLFDAIRQRQLISDLAAEHAQLAEKKLPHK